MDIDNEFEKQKHPCSNHWRMGTDLLNRRHPFSRNHYAFYMGI